MSDLQKLLNSYKEVYDSLDISASFKKDLQRLLNSYSKENGSNTPDFILAEYLVACLEVFNITIGARERWYGRRDNFGEKDITDKD